MLRNVQVDTLVTSSVKWREFVLVTRLRVERELETGFAVPELLDQENLVHVKLGVYVVGRTHPKQVVIVEDVTIAKRRGRETCATRCRIRPLVVLRGESSRTPASHDALYAETA